MINRCKIKYIAALAISLICFKPLSGQDKSYPFQNDNLSFDERVNDLVSRLTLEEKVSQMLNAAPAIKRLNIPAILNAWYEGQAAGNAVADIIFGDYNPSGRLPVTFYKSDDDLPPFTDYTMENRTYRYFSKKPLYGFGYGLSYSNFNYHHLKISSLKTGKEDIKVSVQITNTSKFDGEEVAQLYLINQNDQIKTPLKALKGFERISLKAGETKTVQFTLTPDDYSYIQADGLARTLNNFKIAIGGHQPNEPNKTSGNIVESLVAIP